MASLGPSRRSRLPFVLTAALLAAGLGDPLVELLGDGGLFGAGYHDTNHLGVLPALLCALAVALEIVVVRARAAFRRGPRDGPALLEALASRMAARRPLRDVPLVLPLQLAFVFAIEWGESFAPGSNPVRGLAWLGAPPLAALTLHAIVAAGVTVALARIARAVVAAFASLVRVALAFIAVPRVRDLAGALGHRHDGAAFAQPSRREGRSSTGKRAPPHLLASA